MIYNTHSAKIYNIHIAKIHNVPTARIYNISSVKIYSIYRAMTDTTYSSGIYNIHQLIKTCHHRVHVISLARHVIRVCT